MFGLYNIIDDANSIYKNKETNGVLWLGNINSSLDIPFLKSNKIKLVVNCCKDTYTNNLINKYKKENIKSIHLPIYDYNDDINNHVLSENINKIIEKIHEYISLGSNVLVHCHAGIQRSATVVACYYMTYICTRCNIINTIRYIKRHRPISFNDYQLSTNS